MRCVLEKAVEILATQKEIAGVEHLTTTGKELENLQKVCGLLFASSAANLS